MNTAHNSNLVTIVSKAVNQQFPKSIRTRDAKESKAKSDFLCLGKVAVKGYPQLREQQSTQSFHMCHASNVGCGGSPCLLKQFSV